MMITTRFAWTIALGLGLVAGCNSSSSKPAGGDSGAAGETGTAGESAESPGAAGDSGTAGDSNGTSGSAGEPGNGDAGASSSNGGSDGVGAQLPEGALLYIRHATKDQDVLVARDLEREEEVIITDLTGDGSSGWGIDSFSLSPDRRRVALASLYAPTKEDTATGLATRAIWTLSVEGTDFRRLTPTFPKDAQGRSGFQYSIGGAEWTANGKQLVYNFGEYWYDGTTLEGGTFPWLATDDGKTLPTSFPTEQFCSVIHPSRNPVTGEFVFIHSVCVPGQGEGDGLYLYPAKGGTSPTKLVDSSRAADGIDIFLAKPAWLADGSGFLFIGSTAANDWNPNLLIYDVEEGEVSVLLPMAAGKNIYGVAVAPDTSKIVYCQQDSETNAVDLHLIDLTAATPTDTAITDDGKSCYPSF